jgi:carboxypeptidase Taq
MTNYQNTFNQLRDHLRNTSLLEAAAAALEWDERTGMPSGGADFRAEQVAHLRGLVHERNTAPQLENYLDELQSWDEAADPHGDLGATVRLVRKDFEKHTKLPKQLVESVASATVRGQGVWDAARKADDYGQFQPALDEMISLQREVGQALADQGQTPYEALLNEYEPGAKVSELVDVFANLRTSLVELIEQIQASPKQVDDRLLKIGYPIEKQRDLSRKLAEAIGFDFNRGRLDETSHPFCTTLGPSDCRILTRYESNWLPTSIFGTLHEAGHGLYEQGLRPDWYGMPPGSYASLGIHESQSRLWENLVGRSHAFWQHFSPLMRSTFPSELGDVSVDQLHAMFNRVEPSLIRVEADEATYNLHIIVRFELEQALISGDLSTDDLPAAWSDRYEHVIGIRPPSAADGVLQDVHWSAGLFGYFPTYTLGNLVSAQLYATADDSLGGIDNQVTKGDFTPLLQWLQTNVHTAGRNDSPDELVAKITGKELSAKPLIDSLRARYARVYDF